MTKKEFKRILRLHTMWLNSEEGGVRADLNHAELFDTILINVNLNHAELNYSNLSYTNLNGANLNHANLIGANLIGANLNNANLSNANLIGANLNGTCLNGANLNGINYNEQTAFFALQCPEDGAFIGYKKCDQYIIKLEITESAKRLSTTNRECRASEVLVLDIQNPDGTKSGLTEYLYDDNYTSDGTMYRVGEITKPDSFDNNRWNECSNGIHFFITFQEAVNY